MINNPSTISDQVLNLAETIGNEMYKLKTSMSLVATTGEWKDLKNIPTSLEELGTEIKSEVISLIEENTTVQQAIEQAKNDAIALANEYTDTRLGTLSVADGKDVTVENAIAKAVSDDRTYTDTTLSETVGDLVVAEGEDKTVANAIIKAVEDGNSGTLEESKEYTDEVVGTLVVAEGEDKTVANAIIKAVDDSQSYTEDRIGSVGDVTVKEYIDTSVSTTAKSTLDDAKQYTDDRIGNIQVDDGYEATVENAIAKAVYDAESYTNDKIGELGDSENVVEAITKAINELGDTSSQELSDALGNLSVETGKDATVENAIAKAVSDEADARNEAIAEAISSVYRIKGSVETFNDLPTENVTPGDVYNVITPTGNTPAGTNYVWVGGDDDTEAHWDALGGTIDVTLFVTHADLLCDPQPESFFADILEAITD